MSDTPKKCAHETCLCLAPAGEKFCSPFCEGSKDLTTLECDCGHDACANQKL